MRRRMVGILFVLALCMTLFLAMAMTASAEGNWAGSGTKEDPYKISSRQDLEILANAVNNGQDQAGIYFVQTGDIDLKGSEDDPWPVIGINSGNSPRPFNGVYDGGNYNIFGLYVEATGEAAGLFGTVGEYGIIRRVHVVDCYVHSKALYVGAIAGHNTSDYDITDKKTRRGLVEYCSSIATSPEDSTGKIEGSWQYVGGIVGKNDGIISYCYSNCDVIGEQKVGGITGGQNGGTVRNCYFRGYVYARDITRAYAGGIAGENDGNSTIDNCYSDGIIEGRNNNEYCGAIAGSNDTGSSVENCFWEDSDGTGLPGIASGQGEVKNARERTAEEFASGEVTWDLAQGTDGDGWGQTLDRSDGEPDQHPHFVGQPDKSWDTTSVYKVTLKAPSLGIDDTLYVDPNVDLKLDEGKYKLEWPAAWYLVDENGNSILDDNGLPTVFDGNVIDHDVNAVAGKRILFAGEAEAFTVTGIYSPIVQTLAADMDSHMAYAEKSPSVEGRFTYEITEDCDSLGATLSEDGKVLTIPAGTKVNTSGYVLKINAHEKEPYIAPLSLGPFDTRDVELTVKVIINKADPLIVVPPTASPIDYGKTLAASSLSGGEAQHPTAGTPVEGSFAWTSATIEPTVMKAANVGYFVTFTPRDTENYNTVTILVTLTVNKIDPQFVPPTPIEGLIYNGSAQALINPGSATGGTMMYSLERDGGYSTDTPARANADTYQVWYKVVGDENHNDTEPVALTVTIRPYTINVDPGHVSYNGSNTFVVTLDGVPNEIVVATLTAGNKDVGTYSYAASAESDKYTVVLSSSNYALGDAKVLTIDPLEAVLRWSAPLTFEYDTKPHTVTAVVTNAVEGDVFNLTYEDNEKTAAGDYTAIVTNLGNTNYSLPNASYVSQQWHITQQTEKINIEAKDVTYGDQMTLTVTVSPAPIGTVTFYVNGKLLGSAYVDGNSSKATLPVAATATYGFSAGANAIMVEYDSGNPNVHGGKTAITLNVKPKPITATITGSSSATTKTYDGNDAATGLGIELNGVENCDKGQVAVAADSYTYDNPNAGNGKTITANNAVLSGVQSGNYTLSIPVTTIGVINAKVVRLEWSGYEGLVYTGNAVNVTAVATELIPGDVCTVEVANGDMINAGSYTARAIGLSNSNYILPANGATQLYTIDPAPFYIPALTVNYTGDTTFTVEYIETGVNGETITVTLITSDAAMGNYFYATGDKTYTASITNPNYRIAGGAMLTIGKPAPSYTPPIGKNLIYTGEAQELITAGTVSGGIMMYSLSRDGEYSTSIPTGIEVGTYTIWYIIKGDEDYGDVAPQFVEATISMENPGGPGATSPEGGSVVEPNVPQTGDNSHVALWLALMGISVLGLCVNGFGSMRRKRK